MKARAMNPMAVVAAAMAMMAVVATSPVSAAPSMGAGQAVATRTVMQYGQGAWTAPAAVVLKSEGAWNAWNAMMVRKGKAVGAEAVPAGVDWKEEVLLVVTLGENLNQDWSVALAGATSNGLSTQVTLQLTPGQGGSSPCVVVAMDRRAALSVSLSYAAEAAAAAQMNMPSNAQTYDAPAGAGVVATTWGAMKDTYRN